MADQSNIESAASKSIRPFRSSEEYLYAMKEDLAEWLNTLYDLDIQVDNFMDVLETGFDLCQHANNVNRIAQEFQQLCPDAAAMRVPRKEVVFQSKNVVPGSFVARDNVSNFIQWCRQELGIQDVLMFETNDLVLRKNEKNFVLCLLEVARKGSKFGMLAPMLIQMEEEIEEEIRGSSTFEAAAVEKAMARRDPGPQSPICANKTQRMMTLCDLKNLDELVREILGHCTCPSQFPMVKVSEGKYKVGDSNALIFVRVLRSHVMVRVGGGWDTLEHYLDKHDPCRCTSLAHRLTQTRSFGFSPQKMTAPASQPSSPSVQRRAEAMGHPRVEEKRLPAGGEAGHSKGLRPGCPVKGLRDSTPPRQVSSAMPIPGHDGVSSRSGVAGHSSSASPSRGSGAACESRAPNSLSSLRLRRLSGDSDSSASSVQSGTLGRRRNEDAILVQRKDPGRRVSEGSILQSRPGAKKQLDVGRSQSRERALLPRSSPGMRRRAVDERGRARMANGTGKPTATVQSPHPRVRSQEPVLLISRGKDGQHSWARAEDAAGSKRSTPRGHLAPAGSRSPSLTNRRGSLPATKMAEAPMAPRQRPSACDGSSCVPNILAQDFRTPLRLDPSQEQQLFRRLEEEFLANSQMMGLEEEEEEPAQSLGHHCDGPRITQTAPDPGTTDSAYCSSSSSSSSLNFFTKYGLQEESKRNAAAAQRSGVSEIVQRAEFANGWVDTSEDAWWPKPALSSSSDESNVGLSDRHEQSAMSKPDHVPSVNKTKPRPQIKPRTDSQPDKMPSKIPTPRSYKAAMVAATAAGRPWASFQNALSPFVDPSKAAESGGADEGSWA